MSVTISVIVFILVCLLFRYVSRMMHGQDYLAPLSFFAIYFFITRIPRMIMAEENKYGFHQPITDDMVSNYLITTIPFLFAVLIGALLKHKIVVSEKNKNYGYDFCNINNSCFANKTSLLMVGIICFAIGAISKIYLIVKSGGLLYIWSHLYARTVLLEGAGYIGYLAICITFGLAAIEICVLNFKEKKILFVVLCLVGAFLNIAFGNRSPLLKMLIALFFVYWYASPNKVNWWNFLKFKYIIPVIFIALAVIILPTYRTAHFQLNSTTLRDSVKDASDNLYSIFNEISVYDEDVFTFHHFSSDSFWGGKSYLGLITAWIPRSFYSGKPPIDDGMYLRALMKGYEINPPMSVDELDAKTISSSVPFTTNGIMYANFGILGSIFGGLLIGMILVAQYEKMRVKGFLLEDILIYQFLCIRLSLSTKGIVELIMTIFIIKVLCGSIYKLSKVQKRLVFQRNQ